MGKTRGWKHDVEVIVDRTIPYALILLFFLIIGEILFAEQIRHYSLFVSTIDSFIIGAFVFDLFFKYKHSKTIPAFLRKHWLLIIALFPAFLIVRLVEEFLVVTKLEDAIKFSQEALEIGQKTVLGPTRLSYFSRLIEPLARLPRFLAAFHFYEKPTLRHLNKNIIKNINNVKQRRNKKA